MSKILVTSNATVVSNLDGSYCPKKGATPLSSCSRSAEDTPNPDGQLEHAPAV